MGHIAVQLIARCFVDRHNHRSAGAGIRSNLAATERLNRTHRRNRVSPGRTRMYSSRVGLARELQGGHMGKCNCETNCDLPSPISRGNCVASEGALRSPCCVGFVSDLSAPWRRSYWTSKALQSWRPSALDERKVDLPSSPRCFQLAPLKGVRRSPISGKRSAWRPPQRQYNRRQWLPASARRPALPARGPMVEPVVVYTAG
jgi:hypothetical protein